MQIGTGQACPIIVGREGADLGWRGRNTAQHLVPHRNSDGTRPYNGSNLYGIDCGGRFGTATRRCRDRYMATLRRYRFACACGWRKRHRSFCGTDRRISLRVSHCRPHCRRPGFQTAGPGVCLSGMVGIPGRYRRAHHLSGLGVLWLSTSIGIGAALENGFFPFILGASSSRPLLPPW